MRKIIIFILCLSLVPCAFAAEKKTGKLKEAANKGSPNKAAVKKEAVSAVVEEQPVAWSLSAYPEVDGYLPRNYQGVDPTEFWKFFKEKVSAIQKGESETPEEFARRKADVDTALFPVNASDLYAFRKPDVIVWYDAIGQYYDFRSKDSEAFCDEISMIWNTCKIATVENSENSYLGTFAQGSVTVKRSRVTDFSLAIRKTNGIFHSPSFIYDFTRMGFDYHVRASKENAKRLKGSKFGMLFVGSLTSAEIVSGKGSVTSPTFQDPRGMVAQEEAVPFDLKKIVFYVVDTGRVLEVKDIQP